MKLPATGIAALSLTAALATAAQAAAQVESRTASASAPFTDPANLRGERVSPKTGRELPIDQGTLGLQQLLRKLNTRASLMLIVAHPDDEDGGMLTLYSRGLGARVATLTLTRGEGGQNAMTGDFEDALGLIRTQELLAADRYFGADQLFGTEVDFGFSKTKEEAFRKWTHERVLYDAVRAVRLYRPLVLAAVFVGGVTDGHGQHQVSGQIAQEVFKAAADPNVFPELTAQGILPWAPLKVYARVPSFAIQPQGLFDYATNQYVKPTFTNYVTGETSSTPPTPDIVVHEGETDPLLTNSAANAADLPNPQADPATKLSYVQFARIGLGLQRTQIGPGFRTAPAGSFDVAYHLYGSRLCNSTPSSNAVILSAAKDPCVPSASATNANSSPTQLTFFDGIDTSLEGIASLAPHKSAFFDSQDWRDFVKAIHEAQERFDPQHPEATAPALARASHALDSLGNLPDNVLPDADIRHELAIKRVQLNNALALALRIHLHASTASSSLEVGKSATVDVRLTGEASSEVGFSPILIFHVDPSRLVAQPFACLPAGSPQPFGSVLFERKQLPLTQSCVTPGRLSSSNTRPYFYRDNIEQPFYNLREAHLRNAPTSPAAMEAEVLVRYRDAQFYLDSVVDAGQQPLQLTPPLSLTLTSHAEVLPDNRQSIELSLFTSPPVSNQTIITPPHWTTSAQPGNIERSGHYTYLLQAPSQRKVATVQAEATLPGGKAYTEGFRPVGYPGLPFTNFYTPASTRIVPVDLKLPTHRRIGYLPGTGDAVADNLRSVGFEVTNLTVPDLTPERLSHFDAVILGVRTYNAHPDLHGAPTQALFDFARSGGNVIVQYQTAEFTAADAPYPLTLGNAEKVVDETTPVRLLAPSNLDLSHLKPEQQPWRTLLYPNRITAADFNNWIEERGHGFLHTWDPHYTALTETHDPGAPAEHIAPQLPQEGGLITTPLGKGHWTYVAFALYRQLPEAVPGAFRLFTNLIGMADEK